MKNRIKQLILIIIVFQPTLYLQGQDALYIGSTEEDVANSIVQYDNHFYILGTSRKTSKSSTDYFLLKIDNNGILKKELIFGDFHGDVGKGIFVDQTGIFLLGKTWDGGYPNNDMFLHKLDLDLNLSWSKYYGGEKNDLGHKFIKTRSGDFVMAGFNRTVDDFGDVYLVRTDKNGEVIWENHFGERYIDHGFSVVENEAGELVVAGTKGGFYNPTSTDYLNSDAEIFIIKTDAAGQEIWQKTFGGTSHDWAKAIIQAPGGGYFVCGSTQSTGAGSFDVFLMKLDEDGNQLWLKTYGGTDWEYGESVQLSNDNHLYLLATTASYSGNFKPDHLLIKTDLEGKVIWENTYGGEGSDYSSSIVCTNDSGCVFTGWTDQGAFGRKDIVLFKITKDGKPIILSENIPSERETQILVYPNPAAHFINIEAISENKNPFSFSLFDAAGRKIITKTIESNSKTQIQVSNKSGIYVYRVEEGNQAVHFGKLVIQN